MFTLPILISSSTSTISFFYRQRKFNNGNNNILPSFGMSSTSASGRLRHVQKSAAESSWRACLKRKRQNVPARPSSSQSTSDAAQPFHLEQLPLNTLVIVASQLPFADFKNVGMISRKFNTAQRMTRYSRKRVSVGLLRQLFPDEMPSSRPSASECSSTAPSSFSTSRTSAAQQDDANLDGGGGDCVGMLQVMRPFRRHLRSSPPRNLQEVDLSEFGSFRESHFVELFRSVNNGRELFEDVRRLNVQKCVVELKDMEFLAQLMPKVWYIRCSAHTLVLPNGVEQPKMTLSAEQMRQLRAKVENFVYVSRQCTKKHLWFIAQLTELFAELEVIQLDN